MVKHSVAFSKTEKNKYWVTMDPRSNKENIKKNEAMKQEVRIMSIL